MTNIISSTLLLQKHRDLLRMEYEYDKKSFDVQSSTISLSKKISAGVCRYPLTVGKSYYNSLNQYVVELLHAPLEDEDDHFEYGKSLQFFSVSLNEEMRLIKMASQVCFATPTSLVVTLPGREYVAALESMDRLGVQLGFDESSYKAMFDALDRVMSVKDGRLYDLRETLLGKREAGFFSFSSLRYPWLNGSQEEAINQILRAKDVAIVHGPPGTGKTTTLVEAIYETLRRESQVLVCAQSNMAVDWISEQLVDRGVNVLRIGNPSRVDDKMLSLSRLER